MIRRIFRAAAVLLLIFSLLAPGAAFAAGDVVYSVRRQLADNLEYINTITWDASAGRRESFALNLTGQGDAYPIVLKGDTVFGTTRISAMVSYAESLGYNVLAAVNADFFTVENGVPLGIVIEDGMYKASPEGRNAVVFYPDGGADIIEAPRVSITLRNNGGAEDANNAGEMLRFDAFNKIRSELGRMVLYSEDFSTVSTRTATPGWFVRFRILEGVPTVSGEMTLEVTDTFFANAAVPIGEGYMVLTASERSNTLADFERFAIGDVVTLTTAASDSRLARADYATGGGDIIISDGEVTDEEAWFQLPATRAPRTAFGLRADGSVITYAVDGRNSEHSIGMSLPELANELLNQGAVYAVNFDGGGSTAMSVRLPGDAAARLISRPSDGSERGCATYLLFVTDAWADYRARNLSLRNNGVIVLAESSVELTFAATDSGYLPVSVPRDVQAAPMGYGSSISGRTYTAGGIAGPDRISLFSPSTGAAGYGEIYVITRPTSITATRVGSSAALQSVSLLPGQTLNFDVTATYYRRAVISQLDAYTYDVSGNIGTMVSPGVFEAGAVLGQTGIIRISAGGRSTDIRVEIGGFTDMQNHWAREFAQFLAEAGITQGVSPNRYGPNLMMKRGDFVLMLYRAAGLPDVAGGEPFSDVPTDSYYEKAIDWARAMGITTGTGGNRFSPEASLTRQDAFTFVYRALQTLGIPYTDGSAEDLLTFADAQRVAGYAVVPTATLVRLGVVEGSGGRLQPANTLTRAEMAKILATVLQVK